ncbi:hypothetical protein O6H91_10G047700 [Diphasiastrum complanatum]|uniref:Uncharacterized protein n=2 Tax=Diphasiastrum complanatum TaxID=34168 RepID=A0ACC2CGR9_DIPCM|nr:hypothetical protein O6H91_10G047700 [Diphasiastrum complanatum]
MWKFLDARNAWSHTLYRRKATLRKAPSEILWNTKTMVGDNLDPTPWHPFTKPQLTDTDKRSRAPKILRCTYLTCSFALRNLLKPRKPQFNSDNPESCPSYFQWIHEDLAPWRKTGITIDTIEKARNLAAFRVVIVGGRIYTEFYYHCVQTRTMFTLWGLVMLLERYPGMIPDVDLMFDCMDRPRVRRKDYSNGKSTPPPLFRYCTNLNHYDIPFPDWSYWGWAEVNIKPWDQEMQNIFNGSQKLPWSQRLPVAFWKGNPNVGARVRIDLLNCNSTEKFNAQIFKQDWNAETAAGYKNSNLANQCGHRYKIYAEGHAWSVSFKYIMACGSTVLLVDPEYPDFFMRGLLPLVQYWPIQRPKLCSSIKYAVEWGNNQTKKAEAIGQQGQEFLRDQLGMHNVYDYMFHLLQEYSRLQKFTPAVPPDAHEICRDSILCLAEPSQRIFLKQSDAHNLDIPPPCSMPLPNHDIIKNLLSQQRKNSAKVRKWEP